MCLVTSWIFVLCFHDNHRHTDDDNHNVNDEHPWKISPYGLISGLLMVPGGTAGYFAVRNAGLARAQGIWSSLKVLVAFAWGLLVFGEPVRSYTGTIMAMMLMLMGLAGMSYFASSSSSSSLSNNNDLQLIANQDSADAQMDEYQLLNTEDGITMYGGDDDNSPPDTTNVLCGLGYRGWGIVGAVIDGLYGGSVLVPMHFAKQSDASLEGLGFLFSFAVGCWIVISLVWGARWLWYVGQTRSALCAWQQLPCLHLTTIGPYATLAGLIWSVGNVASILSVALLGQGLGYSIVQCQLIVAGLWAVCFYGEIPGRTRIAGWFAFAILTVVSILLLTRQHQESPSSVSVPHDG